MKSSKISKKFLLIPILGIAIAAIVGIVLLSVQRFNLNAETFVDDGYMLLESNTESESINQQYYFNGGETYRITYDDKVSFNDINGNKVSTPKENFIHYNSGSMNALADTVALNADGLETDQQLSYYSIPAKTILNKNGRQYTLNNAGNNINLSNYIWKIDADHYMVVSDKINLVVNDESIKTFDDYVELRYVDEGVVHLVTQEGTYSTISSDAYLELDNGVRIYIGSKNVSNDEEILMNLTQMNVGSDDNIEVVPDEDYTIENVEQPQIVVNANDGTTGKNGEEGTLGQNGDNGQPGQRGSAGATGYEGKSAPNADVVFEAEQIPVFSDLTITTKPYGMQAKVKYNSNNCVVSDVWVSIVDQNTGNEVWKKNIKTMLPADPTVFTDDIICNTLTADNPYLFSIHATYESPKYPGKVYTQILKQEQFYTDKLGFSLTKKLIGEHSISLNVNKELNESAVKALRVKFYDVNNQAIGYAKPSSTIDPEIILENNYLDVTKMNLGDSLNVYLDELDSNSIYYAQIEMIVSTDSETPVTPGEPEGLNVVSYTKQKYITLKMAPTIEKPSVSLNDVNESFIVSPGRIVDTDNGILSYRLEVYKSGAEDEGPVYTYKENGSSIGNISVPITDNPDDDTKLHRNVKYLCYLIAEFNNNEATSDYRSDVSDEFIAGNSSWPTADFEYDSTKMSASTIDGNIVLYVADYAATFTANSKITVKYEIKNLSSDTTIKNQSGTILSSIPISAFTQDSENKTKYYYPAYSKSLLRNQNYTLTVYCNEFYINGTHFANEKNPIQLAYTNVLTQPKYSSLLVSSTNLKSKAEYVDEYADYTFAIDLKLASANSNEEALRSVETAVPGLYNMGDLSIRSLTYLKLELYDANDPATDSGPNKLIKTINLKDRNNFTYSEGVHYGEHPSYYDLIKNAESTYNIKFGESEYGYKYLFDTSLYEDAYVDQIALRSDPRGIVLTNEFFDDVVSEYPLGSYFYIKVSGYDYTYGLGTGYMINGYEGDVKPDPEHGVNPEPNNVIPIGKTQEYSKGSADDNWISFATSYVIPSIQTPRCKNYLTQSEARANMLAHPTTYVANSNAKDIGESGLTTIWEDQKISLTQTDVGIEYSGVFGEDQINIAQYASDKVKSVCYDLYKVTYDDAGNKVSEKLVDSSGFIAYKYEKGNVNLPSYTFFYDVPGIDGEVIKRGEEYIVQTRLVLKGFDDEVEIDGSLPEDSYAEIDGKNYRVYPNYWKNTGTLPGYDSSVEHTGRMFQELVSDKQTPRVLSYVYSGDANNDISDVMHVVIIDPDNALVKDETGREIVCKGQFDDEGPITDETFGYVSLDPIKELTSEGGRMSAVIDTTPTILPTEGNTFVNYYLQNQNSKSVEDYEASIKHIKLATKENVTPSKDVELQDIEDTNVEFDGRYITINFDFISGNYSIDSNLLGIDVEFMKVTSEDIPILVDDKEVKETIFATPTLLEPTSIPVGEGEDPKYMQHAKVKIDGLNIANIIIGSQNIRVTVKGYFDSGDLGTVYFDGDQTEAFKTSNYYLVQKASADGSAIIPTSSIYPNGYYALTKKTGVNGTEAIKKEITTPLFTRDTVGYSFDSAVYSRYSINSGSNYFDINGTGLTPYTITGLAGGIIKNVSSSNVSCVTEMHFINPAVSVDIITGYKTAIMDITIPSAKITLKDDQTVLVEYKKKDAADWPAENVVELEYHASELTGSDKVWKNVTIEDLENNVGTTQYVYRIRAIPNGSPTGDPIILNETSPGSGISGSFDVSKYAHYDGLATVVSSKDGETKTRNTKDIVYTLTMKNIIPLDVNKNLSKVLITIHDTDDITAVTDANKVSEKEVSISELLGEISPSSKEKVDVECDVNLDWEPDTKHNMNAESATGKPYVIKVSYVYGADTDAKSTVYRSIDTKSVPSITGWNSLMNNTYYSITVSKNVDITATSVNYQLIYKISGKDTHRLLSLDSSNKVTYLLELWRDVGNDGKKSNDVIARADDVTETGNYQRQFSISDITIDNSDSISQKSYTFSNLKPHQGYYVKLYYVVDGDNTNTKEIKEFLDIDDTKIKTEDVIVAPGSVKTKGSGVYEKDTGIVDTESSGNIRIGGAILHPDTKQVYIIGTNLNYVKAIVYELIENDGEVKKVYIPNPVSPKPGETIHDLFTQEPATSNLYYLSVPLMSDTSATYKIRINFYASESYTESLPTTSVEGTYPVIK